MKYTIQFTDEANSRIQKLANDRGLTKAGVIRHALAAYAVISETVGGANCVTILRPDGTPRELINV